MTPVVAAPGVSAGMLRRAGGNVLWASVGEIAGKALWFVSLIWIARAVGVEHNGVFSFAQMLITYLWLGVDLGLNFYGPREVARDPGRGGDLLNAILTIRLAFGIVVFAGFIVFATLLASGVSRLVFVGLAFTMLFRALYTDWFLRGTERFRLVAIGNVAASVLLLALIVAFVRTDADVVRAAFVWSLAHLGGAVVFLALTLRAHRDLSLSPVRPSAWMPHLKESMYFTLSSGLSTVSQQVPLALLWLFGSAHAVGLYAGANRIVFGIIFVASILPMAVFPIFSALHDRRKGEFRALFNLSLAVMTVVSLAVSGTLFVGADMICLAILGAEYAPAAGVLRILAWFVLLRSVRTVFVRALAAAGLQRLYALTSFAGVVLLVGLYVALDSLLHMTPLTSAALALVLAEVGILTAMAVIWLRSDVVRGEPVDGVVLMSET